MKKASDGRVFYQDGYWTSWDLRDEQFPHRVPQDEMVYEAFEKFYK
ncbi:MAG: hypothetical protein ACTSRA_14955 [Promethearchaeota archaeon]